MTPAPSPGLTWILYVDEEARLASSKWRPPLEHPKAFRLTVQFAENK
jgi:hypothetical protein